MWVQKRKLLILVVMSTVYCEVVGYFAFKAHSIKDLEMVMLYSLVIVTLFEERGPSENWDVLPKISTEYCFCR